MGKIGLVSFHTKINYGVYLQAYALQEKVKAFGYNPIIIDYRKRTDEKYGRIQRIYERIFQEQISLIDYFKAKVKSELIKRNERGGVQRRQTEFNRFLKENFVLSRRYNSYQDVINDNIEYDACICGSDQIWNPNYTKFNPLYYLEFVEPYKRIAYAPSIAVERLTEKQESILMDKMQKFNFLSLRESSASIYWGEKLGKVISNVVDPTLLFHKNFWSTIAVEPKEKEHFLLCYFLEHNDLYELMINLISEVYKLKVIILPFSYEAIFYYVGQKIYASIEEFLGYIKNANFILTDSFHGTVFSVIFNKDFYTIKRQDKTAKMHSRIKDFLEKIDLESRVISNGELSAQDVCRIDYEIPNQKLELWREKSNSFLESSLEGVVKRV